VGERRWGVAKLGEPIERKTWRCEKKNKFAEMRNRQNMRATTKSTKACNCSMAINKRRKQNENNTKTHDE